jgi:2C-methyl-D-erythritol 2,4-cyclodiphosphate synthase
MPYKRKPLPKTPAYKKQVDSNTKKINTLVKNIEYKFFEVTTNESFSNDQIVEDSLIKIAQGDTESTRDGRKIVITGIHFKGYMVLDANNSGDAVRLVLYVDKQPNGATAATTDYWASINKNGYSFRNLTQTKRFRVLSDKTYVINNVASTVTKPIRRIEYNFKVNIPINYTSTLGAITELQETNIGLMSSSLGSGVDLDGIWRIRYQDT